MRQALFKSDMKCLQEKRCIVHSHSEETLLKLALPKQETCHFMYQLYKSSKDENLDSNADKLAQYVFLERRDGMLVIKVCYFRDTF